MFENILNIKLKLLLVFAEISVCSIVTLTTIFIVVALSCHSNQPALFPIFLLSTDYLKILESSYSLIYIL